MGGIFCFGCNSTTVLLRRPDNNKLILLGKQNLLLPHKPTEYRHQDPDFNQLQAIQKIMKVGF
jgi:hypothetical protein